jgi:hypothetical protein
MGTMNAALVMPAIAAGKASTLTDRVGVGRPDLQCSPEHQVGAGRCQRHADEFGSDGAPCETPV